MTCEPGRASPRRGRQDAGPTASVRSAPGPAEPLPQCSRRRRSEAGTRPRPPQQGSPRDRRSPLAPLRRPPRAGAACGNKMPARQPPRLGRHRPPVYPSRVSRQRRQRLPQMDRIPLVARPLRRGETGLHLTPPARHQRPPVIVRHRLPGGRHGTPLHVLRGPRPLGRRRGHSSHRRAPTGRMDPSLQRRPIRAQQSRPTHPTRLTAEQLHESRRILHRPRPQETAKLQRLTPAAAPTIRHTSRAQLRKVEQSPPRRRHRRQLRINRTRQPRPTLGQPTPHLPRRRHRRLPRPRQSGNPLLHPHLVVRLQSGSGKPARTVPTERRQTPLAGGKVHGFAADTEPLRGLGSGEFIHAPDGRTHPAKIIPVLPEGALRKPRYAPKRCRPGAGP